ncbi:MAG: hypothetical protein M9962_14470, partial [Oligoflexia bacterium]|nr:hypothetical protein [Oligoflexia bacterium]
ERLATKLNGKPRWFYGAGNYELFFIEDLGNILRFELEWQGHVFTREYGKPLRAGFINSEDRDKPSHAKSAIVQWQKEYSQELLIKAARIVENIPGLELEFRKQIQKFLLEM